MAPSVWSMERLRPTDIWIHFSLYHRYRYTWWSNIHTWSPTFIWKNWRRPRSCLSIWHKMESNICRGYNRTLGGLWNSNWINRWMGAYKLIHFNCRNIGERNIQTRVWWRFVHLGILSCWMGGPVNVRIFFPMYHWYRYSHTGRGYNHVRRSTSIWNNWRNRRCHLSIWNQI